MKGPTGYVGSSAINKLKDGRKRNGTGTSGESARRVMLFVMLHLPAVLVGLGSFDLAAVRIGGNNFSHPQCNLWSRPMLSLTALAASRSQS